MSDSDFKEINRLICGAYSLLKYLENNRSILSWKQEYQIALDKLDYAKRLEANFLGIQRGPMVYYVPD